MELPLVELFLLLSLAKLGGEAAERVGQPSLLGELLIGMVFVPVFGLFIEPDFSSVEFISSLGILLLLFMAGLHIDFNRLKDVGKSAFSAAFLGFVIPFGLGILLADYYSMGLLEALFLATGLSITAIPVSVKILMDFGVMESRVALTIVGAGVIDDILAVIVIGAISSLAISGEVSYLFIFYLFLKIVVFLILSFTLGFIIIEKIVPYVFSMRTGGAIVSFGLAVALGMAYLAEALGLHGVIGAFVAGLVLGNNKEYKDPVILDRFESYILGLFAPIFFAWVGISFYFSLGATDLQLAFIVVLVSLVGKFLGGGIGAKMGGLDILESISVGVGMNARGAIELIVVSIGVSLHAIGPAVINSLVIMALITTLITPVVLKKVLLYRGYLHSKYKGAAE